MAKGKKRLKAAAVPYAAQTKTEVIDGIKSLGDLQRQLTRIETEMNDQIAAVTQYHAPEIERLKAEISGLQQGIQTWCEANRTELTQDGKTKTVNLTTGEVIWRNRPPSCTIRGAEAVIAALKRLKLTRFIRSKEEINKDAILNEQAAVKDIPGITINRNLEDFTIVPFEQEIAQ
ncbi:TPA: host-nuclease inhibitor Gam family protein [Serratia marcescens]|uniref:host-nuclease inhibitor Gam family protein n=1 Tax=Serratia marcescens TaxID=615 RepID=UPI001153645A|nr:host-nuclease inhibitor Gam family protein [Serratia marcescens]MBH3263606.1 host-nuclease inhibitor Gam family protein [Serratia marcescens]QDI15259.1 host-nuclease inhibitor protein Gam [Serratia marcescens]QDI25000.1 host-nuclease inhibitor protein Gam [Serratia marcescens]HEM7575905.1 host-nuclease inhibitor Gam family protein [Serratia marcescens]